MINSGRMRRIARVTQMCIRDRCNALAWPILVTTTPDWRPISYGLLAFLDEAGAIFNLQMAGAVITMLPIVVLYFFTQRTFIEGIATTGLKG